MVGSGICGWSQGENVRCRNEYHGLGRRTVLYEQMEATLPESSLEFPGRL